MPGIGQAQRLAGSPANYWPLDWRTISSQQYTLSTTEGGVGVFKEPHATVTGTVIERIAETDGDTHLWVRLDSDPKSRFAVEITPQHPISPEPAVGDHGQFFGIFRYDAQHAWFEIHPLDGWVRG